jgi:predicted peptidase
MRDRALAVVLTARILLSPGCAREELGTRQTAVQRGFQTKHYVDRDGRRWRYVVFVPDVPPGGKSPVVLFLNGVGQNGGDGLRQASNNFGLDVWRRRDTFPFFALCPKCSEGGSWTAGGADAARALAILDDAVRSSAETPTEPI